MAAPPSRPDNRPAGKQPNPPRHLAPVAAQPEAVDPIWLIKGFGVVLVAAFICGYLTLCLLLYQGQWQLVLHPKRSTVLPVSIAGDPVVPIHFAVDEAGVPQLVGWWLPAKQGARFANDTILYMPNGDGSLADDVTRLGMLHALGINVFAFDYRGYGQSAGTHPNQSRMTQDAAAAWQYLTTTRSLAANTIIPFGDGVGAFLALQLTVSQPAVKGVIANSPRTNLIDVVLADPRTRSLPVRALFHESFDVAGPLSTLKTPKLFLVTAESPALAIARSAISPKQIVVLPSAPSEDDPLSAEQISRFLDSLPR